MCKLLLRFTVMSDVYSSLRIKRRPEALGHQKLSRASKFSFRASKFFFFFMFTISLRMSFGPASSETLMQRLLQVLYLEQNYIC